MVYPEHTFRGLRVSKRTRAASPRAHTQRQKASIYAALKDKIVFLELKPGEFLNETRLAAELGVSRTLLREVIQRLIVDGLLVAVPGQGVHVEGIDLIHFKNTFEVRLSLEEVAGRLAAERIRPEQLEEIRQIIERGGAARDAGDFKELARLDWRFHAVIGEATRNPKLAQILLHLLGPFNRLWYIAMSDFGQVGDVVGDWQRVLDALERRSVQEAAKALIMHMTVAPALLLPVLPPATEHERLAGVRGRR